MIAEELEKCREREDNLEVAVLEAATGVARAITANFCMGEKVVVEGGGWWG